MEDLDVVDDEEGFSNMKKAGMVDEESQGRL